jgi:hypothetical protein
MNKIEMKKKTRDDDSDAESEDSVEDDEFDGFLNNFEKGLEDTEFDVDFASGFDRKGHAKGKKSNKNLSDSDDNDDDDDLSEEEMDFDDDDDFKEAFDDSDDNDDGSQQDDVEFDDDADDDDDVNGDDEEMTGEQMSDLSDDDESQAKVPVKKAKLKAMMKGVGSSLFASADKFSSMLEDNADTRLDMIGSGAVSRKDNADAKQLVWEADRERWMEGRHWKQTKGRSGKPPHKGSSKSLGNGSKGVKSGGVNKAAKRG